MEGYCMKCKAMKGMQNVKDVTMKNGKPASEGVCPDCRTKIFKIGDFSNDGPDVTIDPTEPVGVADEGRELVRQHKVRERNASLVQQKKAWALQNKGNPCCEVCGFIYTQKYGSLGEGFIECHHTVPVSKLVSGQKTRLEDLALVCANCHRMLHRKREVLSIEELKKAIESV